MARADGAGVHRKREVETSGRWSARHTLYVDVQSVAKDDRRRRLGREPVSDQALASGPDEEESGRLADDSHRVRGGIVGGHGLSEKLDVLSEGRELSVSSNEDHEHPLPA